MSSPDYYAERILDYDLHPRNRRWLERADIESHGSSAVCGDDVMIQVKLAGGVMDEVAFTGRGCAISQGAASILTEVARGRTLAWAEESSEEDIFAMLGLGGHRKTRAACELLGIRALRNGVLQYRNSQTRR
jgi:nitrogen fixation NifU-like protein